MFAPVQRSMLVLLVFGSACAGRLEEVIRGQAAGDLSCPESQVTVSGRSGGGGVRNYVVSACGRERSYQAACNSLGTCVAYPVRGRAEASPGGEDLWADAREPASTAAAEPGPEDTTLLAPLAAARAEALEVEGSPSDVPDGGSQTGVPGGEEPVPVDVPVVRSAEAPGEPRAVTLRNECERTVALFIGADPATGAGRYTSLGSMNTATLRLRPGEPVWLLDVKGAGLTSIGVTGEVEEIAVLAGCEGLAAR
jgi:hypothetical protein